MQRKELKRKTDRQMRKTVQIAVNHQGLYALCDDGTIWEMHYTDLRWIPVDGVPAGKTKRASRRR